MFSHLMKGMNVTESRAHYSTSESLNPESLRLRNCLPVGQKFASDAISSGRWCSFCLGPELLPPADQYPSGVWQSATVHWPTGSTDPELWQFPEAGLGEFAGKHGLLHETDFSSSADVMFSVLIWKILGTCLYLKSWRGGFLGFTINRFIPIKTFTNCTIFMLQHFQPVPVPVDQYGTFYDGDSYIVLAVSSLPNFWTCVPWRDGHIQYLLERSKISSAFPSRSRLRRSLLAEKLAYFVSPFRWCHFHSETWMSCWASWRFCRHVFDKVSCSRHRYTVACRFHFLYTKSFASGFEQRWSEKYFSDGSKMNKPPGVLKTCFWHKTINLECKIEASAGFQPFKYLASEEMLMLGFYQQRRVVL